MGGVQSLPQESTQQGGLRATLTYQNKLVVAVGGVTALAAGIYSARKGAHVMPYLIRESSRGNYPLSRFFSHAMRSVHKKWKNAKKNDTGLNDVVLNPSLQKKIEWLAQETSDRKVHQVPFCNILFYGPVGTGKTMAAKELARISGLDYAIMSGLDITPLGLHAGLKIHQIFDWSKKSSRGLLLFIDDADAFLCQRPNTNKSEAHRIALNAFLLCTDDQSKDFVLALATNRPGDLYSDVIDRIDVAIEFPLPGEDERFKLLKLYLNKYIVKAGDIKPSLLNPFKRQPQIIMIKGITDDILREVAAETKGFSCREIAKLMAVVQLAVYGSKDCELNATLFREVVDNKVTLHHLRKMFKMAGASEST